MGHCAVASVFNDKGDNEMIPGAVHRSGICLTAEENPGKPQLGDGLMKLLYEVIVSNGVPFLQMRSIGSQSTSGREKEGKNKINLSKIKKYIQDNRTPDYDICTRNKGRNIKKQTNVGSK